MELFAVNKDEQISNSDLKFFELLYDTFSAKIFGFLVNQNDSKTKADELLSDIFFKIWADIKYFEKDSERKIIKILLSESRKCKNKSLSQLNK